MSSRRRALALALSLLIVPGLGAFSSGMPQTDTVQATGTGGAGSPAASPAAGAAGGSDEPGSTVLEGIARATAPDCPPGARALLRTGHRGEVLALEYDEARGLLFSAGEDGTVRVWDPARRALLHRLQVTHLSAAILAINPAGASTLAVLETDGSRSRAISVWDWEKEKRLFRVELAETPLFLRFSGGGSMLAWGESRWESLHIVNAETGAAIPFAREGFGIVSFAEIGASERTIMTYQLSGRIAYWDLASGNLLREVASVPYLSAVRLSRDLRYLVGSTGTEAVVVDALSGAVRARTGFPGVLSADFSPEGDRVAIAAGPGRASGLSLWSLASDSLDRIPDAPAYPTAVIARFAGQGLLVAARGGEIQTLSWFGEPGALGRDELDRVTGIDVSVGRVALATSSRVWVFSSRLLTGPSSERNASLSANGSGPEGTAATLVDAFWVANPHNAASGVSFLTPERVLVWKRGEASGAAAVLDITSRTYGSAGGESRGPLIESEVLPPGNPLAGQLLSLGQGGDVSLSDPLTGRVRFEARLPGVSTVTAVGRTELVGGRNAAVASEGSLLRINMETGETVAVPSSAVFTYDVLYEPSSGALYSIGVDSAGTTSLRRHSGRGFETETMIDRVDWEDLFAGLAFDPSTGLLFSSLGSARIGVWDAGSLALMKFPDTGRIPRTLRVRDGLLFALGRDSTVAIWDERGEALAEISVFPDGEWCFLFSGGRFASSPGGLERVSVIVGGQPVAESSACRVQ